MKVHLNKSSKYYANSTETFIVIQVFATRESLVTRQYEGGSHLRIPETFKNIILSQHTFFYNSFIFE